MDRKTKTARNAMSNMLNWIIRFELLFYGIKQPEDRRDACPTGLNIRIAELSRLRRKFFDRINPPEVWRINWIFMIFYLS